ncbi:hypothetical protein H257_16276 [Aphanomyces astaci]|uniref:Chromo domain-containing protein n=1 Tax=Aphanomyces astaci TaxID=112090 RepID=W4FJ93_APHAT|nr:hypothetical protein H257_16276 [Aphanomyces astaci]ETV67545.1 hypothetical protein H257_16276 [Aphanomyces astaci]|eukprot:XP_009842949.1 hypothetical protein H257_16276 [Aphanomyces astaci]
MVAASRLLHVPFKTTMRNITELPVVVMTTITTTAHPNALVILGETAVSRPAHQRPINLGATKTPTIEVLAITAGAAPLRMVMHHVSPSRSPPRFRLHLLLLRLINDNAMRLKLPPSMSRVHDVFNVDRLKHYHPNEAKRTTGEEMYIVEKLLKKCQFKRKLEYLVKWHGHPESEATWELMKDIKHVVHFKQLVQDLESRRFKVYKDVRGENVAMWQVGVTACHHLAHTQLLRLTLANACLGMCLKGKYGLESLA